MFGSQKGRIEIDIERIISLLNSLQPEMEKMEVPIKVRTRIATTANELDLINKRLKKIRQVLTENL